MKFQLDGATYKSTLKSYGGGVGRNIAEGLSKLYGNVNLISKIGKDQVSKAIDVNPKDFHFVI